MVKKKMTRLLPAAVLAAGGVGLVLAVSAVLQPGRAYAAASDPCNATTEATECTAATAEGFTLGLQNANVRKVTLADDVTGNFEVPAGRTLEIDLNGKTIASASGTTLTNVGDLTISGTGEVKASTGYNVRNIGAKLTINGGTYTGVNGGSNLVNGYDLSGGMKKTGAEYPELVINGGTFNGGMNNVKNDESGVTTINGGTFVDIANANKVQNVGVNILSGGKSLVVNGGSYNGVVVLQNTGADMEKTFALTGGTFETGGTYQGIIYTDVDATSKDVYKSFEVSNVTLRRVVLGNRTNQVLRADSAKISNVELVGTALAAVQPYTTGTVEIENVNAGGGISTAGYNAGMTIKNATFGKAVSFYGPAKVEGSTFNTLNISGSKADVTLDDSKATTKLVVKNGKAVINSGTYKDFSADGGQTTINGGTFEGKFAVKQDKANVTVVSGAYATKPAEEDIVEGHEAEETENGWEVVPIEVDWLNRGGLWNSVGSTSVAAVFGESFSADHRATLSLAEKDVNSLTPDTKKASVELVKAVDVKMLDRDEAVIPVSDSKVRVYIDITSEEYAALIKYDKVVAIYFDEQGNEVERIDAELKGSEAAGYYVEFTTSHFSTYGIAGVNEEVAAGTPETGTVTAAEASATSAGIVTVAAVAVIVAVAGVTVAIRRK